MKDLEIKLNVFHLNINLKNEEKIRFIRIQFKKYSNETITKRIQDLFKLFY